MEMEIHTEVSFLSLFEKAQLKLFISSALIDGSTETFLQGLTEILPLFSGNVGMGEAGKSKSGKRV